MGKVKYSQVDEVAGFAFLASALGNQNNGDGDSGYSFPRSDAEDLSTGARFIPGEVTLARRAGHKVNFVTECGPNCWYWHMSDGSRVYHWDPVTYEAIGKANGRKKVNRDFKDGVGPCPDCGNINMSGGTVPSKARSANNVS